MPSSGNMISYGAPPVSGTSASCTWRAYYERHPVLFFCLAGQPAKSARSRLRRFHRAGSTTGDVHRLALELKGLTPKTIKIVLSTVLKDVGVPMISVAVRSPY